MVPRLDQTKQDRFYEVTGGIKQDFVFCFKLIEIQLTEIQNIILINDQIIPHIVTFYL